MCVCSSIHVGITSFPICWQHSHTKGHYNALIQGELEVLYAVHTFARYFIYVCICYCMQLVTKRLRANCWHALVCVHVIWCLLAMYLLWTLNCFSPFTDISFAHNLYNCFLTFFSQSLFVCALIQTYTDFMAVSSVLFGLVCAQVNFNVDNFYETSMN